MAFELFYEVKRRRTYDIPFFLQETSVIVVHLIGAFLAFGVGFIYCLLQTIMSYKMNDEIPGNSIYMRRIRVVLCVIICVLLIIRILLS